MSDSPMYRMFKEYRCVDCDKRVYIGRILNKDLNICPSCKSEKGMEYVQTLFFLEEGMQTQVENEEE